MSLVIPNPNCSETYLPTIERHSTCSPCRRLGGDQAPPSNITEGGVSGSYAFSQRSDEGGQGRLSKGRQGFKQRASMENPGSPSSKPPSPGNDHSDAIQ